jgi:hypothetical protein
VLAAPLLLLLASPAPARAWGTSAHRHIMARALDALPPELKPFFDRVRDEVVMRVVDPDLWRNAGWEDDPNHFLDFGVPEFGPYPFTALPREYGAAIEKFGMATLKRDGLLPWRFAEEFGNLRRGFEGLAHQAPFSAANAALFAAVASHYLQDAHQPLHATNNFDGQLTGQRGVHARFESALFERFHERLTVTPPPVVPLGNARDAAFDALLESYRLVQPLLDADKAAMAGRSAYDDEYFERFFEKVKPILERRLADSIAATAAMIVGAWEQAGKPVLTRAGRVRPADAESGSRRAARNSSRPAAESRGPRA